MFDPNKQIMLVKIHQLYLQTPTARFNYDTGKREAVTSEQAPWQYFPFDRLYITSKENSAIFKRMFHYYITAPVTDFLLRGLDQLTVNFCRTIPIHRDGDQLEEKLLGKDMHFSPLLPEKNGPYMLAVPTIVGHYELFQGKNREMKTTDGSPMARIIYVLSSAVSHRVIHRVPAEILAMRLHTPERTYPSVCIACQNQAKFLSGDCAPMEHTCSWEGNVYIRTANMHKDSLNQNFHEFGGNT